MNLPSNHSRDKRRYADTIRQAHLGVREAQYEVGLMYANGIGTAQNLALAIEWVAKAADRGLASAQYLLGTRYALGIVVERDERIALGWYLSAAQQGHAKATLALGKFFSEPHVALANAHIEIAAQAGNAEAQYAWAIALGKQADSASDRKTVVRWLASAAKLGHSKAQVLLGKAYATGSGVAQDLEQAREWLRIAVRQNSPLAFVALAELDAQGGRGPVTRASLRGRSTERRETREHWDKVQAGQDAEETFALGVMFEKGLGVAVDLDRAVELYRIAAERGDPQAQCALASVLSQDHQFEALQWAESAAQAGSPDGMLLAGALHLKRLEHGAEGALAAASWFGQAARAGIAQGAKGLEDIMSRHADKLDAECLAKQALAGEASAQLEYGRRLEEGRGVKQNPSEAARWVLLAAEAGHAPAQTHWALSLLAGTSASDGLEQAAGWLEKAALQGDHLAQWHLGGLFAKGGKGLEQDLKQAFHWCRLAANGGFVPAQATLGYLYNRIGDENLARHWLELAAKAGDAEAQLNLALHITRGDESGSSLELAADWLLTAAEQGLAVAQTELGLRYVKGQGLVADPIEAHKWFLLAANQLEPAAVANLQLSGAKLTASQVSEAARRARNWTSKRQPFFHNVELLGNVVP